MRKQGWKETTAEDSGVQEKTDFEGRENTEKVQVDTEDGEKGKQGDASYMENEHTSITITTEDDRQVVCRILKIFDIDGQQYIVVIPEDGSTEGRGFLFRLFIEEDGSPRLEKIEDDREFAAASSVFSEFIENIDLTE